MAKSIKYTNVRTGEVLEFDPENVVTGPVKIKKPDNYVTPQQLFSSDFEYLSEAEKDREADETARYIMEHGVD